MLRLTNAGWLAVLANMKTADGGPNDGLFATAHVGLFIDGPGFTPDMVLTDLDPATYTGYARKAVTWLAPIIGGDNGYPSMVGTVPEFRPTDGVTPNTIKGYFITEALAGTDLLAIEYFDTLVPLENALNALLVRPEIQFDPDSSIGAATLNF